MKILACAPMIVRLMLASRNAAEIFLDGGIGHYINQ